MTYYNITYPEFSYLCTVQLSRKAYPEMPGHRLNHMADAFGIKFLHHNAEEDAYVCARVLLRIMEDFDITETSGFKKHFGIAPTPVFPGCDDQKPQKGGKSRCV